MMTNPSTTTMAMASAGRRKSSADSTSSSLSAVGPLLDDSSTRSSFSGSSSRHSSPTLPPLDPNELPSILRRSPHLLSPPVTPPRPIASLYSDACDGHHPLTTEYDANDALGLVVDGTAAATTGCTHPHSQQGEYFGLLKLSNRVQPHEGTDLPTTPPSNRSRASSARNSPSLPGSSSDPSPNTVHLDFDRELDGDLGAHPYADVDSRSIDAFLAEHDTDTDATSPSSLSSSPLRAVRGLGLPHGMYPSPRSRVEQVKRSLLGLSPSGSGLIAPLPTPVGEQEQEQEQYPWLQSSMAAEEHDVKKRSMGCWPLGGLLRRQEYTSTVGVAAAWMPPPSKDNGLQLVSATPPVKPLHKLSPWFIIPVWISLSASVVLFNKYLYSSGHFRYPVFLTAYHMLFATVCTRLMARFTHLLDDVKHRPLPRRVWIRSIVPLGLLFSASLILSNVAYVHLSVSFVQMLKALMPVCTLLVSFAARVATPNATLLGVIALISFGCLVAVRGELAFEWVGFICQMAAIVTESLRLVLVQILLQDMKMDPLVSVYRYAPVCFVCIAVCVPFYEGMAPFRALATGAIPTLLLNGALAFSLNIAGVFLVQSAGSLVLTVSGVFKDILMVTFSVLLLGSQVSLVQAVGYSMALTGLIIFKQTGGKELPVVCKWKKQMWHHKPRILPRSGPCLSFTMLLAALASIALLRHNLPAPAIIDSTALAAGSSDTLIVTVNDQAPHVPLEPAIPLDLHTMTAINNYMYAQAIGASYLYVVLRPESPQPDPYACRHPTKGPMPTSLCKLPVLHHLLRDARYSFQNIIYVGPDTTLRYPYRSPRLHLDYLSARDPIGLLTNSPIDMHPYTDYLVLTCDAAVASTTLLASWFDQSWQSGVAQGDEERFGIAQGLNLPVDSSNSSRLDLTRLQNRLTGVTMLDARPSHDVTSLVVKAKQLADPKARYEAVRAAWPAEHVPLNDRQALARLLSRIQVRTADADQFAEEMMKEAGPAGKRAMKTM